MSKPITTTQFRNFVGNQVFTVEFIKKDGTKRTMNARLNVKKYVKGTQPETTAKRKATNESRNQIGVYELATSEQGLQGAEKYRIISLDTILQIKAKGKTLINEIAVAMFENQTT